MNITNYLIEANLGLIFFIAVYFLILHRETQFNVKRAYLLGAMLASVVFPLITIPSFLPKGSTGTLISEIYLPEVVIRTGASQASYSLLWDLNFWSAIAWLYALVTGLLFLRFVIKLGKLFYYLNLQTFYQDGNFKIAEAGSTSSTFSFFYFIVVGNAHQLEAREKEKIIQHEKIHASGLHSIDILLIELVMIAFWFNPIISLLKKQLISIHEYEADQKSVENGDVYAYCSMLARVSLLSAGISFVNHFNNSLTIKRIVMINREKTRIKSWKYLMLVPAFVYGFFVLSCQDQVNPGINSIATSSLKLMNVPPEISDKVRQLQQAFPNREYIITETTENGAESFDQLSQSADKSKSEIISISRFDADRHADGTVRKFIIIEKGTKADAARAHTNAYSVADGERIYEAVQQPPIFPGGMAALSKYISNELHYPPQARRMGIEGKVFVQFIVDHDGKVSNASMVKGIGGGCDVEAVRVVANSPNWNPGKTDGKAVNVRYIIPINFTLD